MLLLERDPLVLTEHSREGSLSDRLAASGSQGSLCSPAVPAGELRPSGLPPHVPRRATLLLWVAVVALSHFDRGAATAAAVGVAAGEGKAHLSFARAAALLASHSVGLALGGAVAGAALQRASAKAALLLAMLADAASLLLLSVQAEASLAVTAVLRAVSGLAASFPLVFLPLWVDEFSPPDASGRWMAIVQTGVPVGQALGVVAAVALTATSEGSGGQGWRGALLAQAVALVPLALRVLLVPAAQVDVANFSSLRARLDSLTPTAEGSQLGRLHGFLRETREMLQGVSRNPLNTSLMTTLCLLQFTAAALALWAAPFLALSPGAPSQRVVLLAMALLLALAPALGTYVGALLCNRMDGFKAGQHAAALRVACAFVVVAGGLSGVDDLTFSDVSYELSRRRMSTSPL